jgi:hypothetical protein
MLIKWKEKKPRNCQLTLLYPGKLTFIVEGETKTSHEKKGTKDFMTTTHRTGR